MYADMLVTSGSTSIDFLLINEGIFLLPFLMQELLGRPIRLKMSEKNDDPKKEEKADEQPEES